MDLFGILDRSEVKLKDMTLPCLPVREIDKNKLKSLSEKFHSILQDYMHYYPDISHLVNYDYEMSDRNEAMKDVKLTVAEEKKVKPSLKKPKSKQAEGIKVPGVMKRKAGRPKNVVNLDYSKQTTMTML